MVGRECILTCGRRAAGGKRALDLSPAPWFATYTPGTRKQLSSRRPARFRVYPSLPCGEFSRHIEGAEKAGG